MTRFGESGSEVSHFIPEPKNFAEVKKLSDNIKKPWVKETIKEIKNLINNQTLLIEDRNEVEPVTPCMDVYKAKIQYDGSLDKLKLRIVVGRYLQNKGMVGDNWSPTASMRTLKCSYHIRQTYIKSPSIIFHWIIIASQSKEQSFC